MEFTREVPQAEPIVMVSESKLRAATALFELLGQYSVEQVLLQLAEAYGKQHDQALSQGRSQEASLSLDRWAALMTGLGSLAIELMINQSSEIN
jgi:hypothetical protein